MIDVISGVEVLEYYAGVAQSLQGSHIDLPPEAFAIMRREPLGCVRRLGHGITHSDCLVEVCTGTRLRQHHGVQAL